MSKSVEELFRDAPPDATHYAGYCHYKKVNDVWMVHMDGDEWDKSSSMYNGDIKPADIVERPQPKPWSGPEDGLPPIGSKCRVVKIYGIDAPLDTECKIVAHEMNGENMVAVYMHGKAYAMYVGIGISDCFSLTKSPDARETAIRELMDIAQVDCRVTAARLVDAGFKREWV